MNNEIRSFCVKLYNVLQLRWGENRMGLLCSVFGGPNLDVLIAIFQMTKKQERVWENLFMGGGFSNG